MAAAVGGPQSFLRRRGGRAGRRAIDGGQFARATSGAVLLYGLRRKRLFDGSSSSSSSSNSSSNGTAAVVLGDLLRFGYGGEPDTDPVRMRRRAEAAEDRHALSAVTALLARHDLGRAYRARVRYDRVGTNDSLGYPLAVGANNNNNHRHPSRVAPHAVHSERTVAVIPVGGGEAAGEARKKLRAVLRQFRAESEEAWASFATSKAATNNGGGGGGGGGDDESALLLLPRHFKIRVEESSAPAPRDAAKVPGGAFGTARPAVEATETKPVVVTADADADADADAAPSGQQLDAEGGSRSMDPLDRKPRATLKRAVPGAVQSNGRRGCGRGYVGVPQQSAP